MPPASSTPPPEPTDDDLLLLRRFRELAARAVADPSFSVAMAAQLLGMSERSFYRRFQSLTGLTPGAYLRAHRLDAAYELLRTGSVTTVGEAAFAVGFEDVEYFARRFYRRFRQRAADVLAQAPGPT